MSSKFLDLDFGIISQAERNDSKNKGNDLLKQAKKEKSGGILGIFDGEEKQRIKKNKSVNLYVSAANAFKIGRNWDQAGYAFIQASEIQKEIDGKQAVAASLIEAAICFTKCDLPKALEAYEEVIVIYTELGQLANTVEYHIITAEIARECRRNGTTLQHYQSVVDYYKSIEDASAVDKYSIEVAKLFAITKDHAKAAEMLENLGEKLLVLENTDGYKLYFKAALCHMFLSFPEAAKVVNLWLEKNPSFGKTREYQFLEALLAAAKEKDVNAFANTYLKFLDDSDDGLDGWMLVQLRDCIC